VTGRAQVDEEVRRIPPIVHLPGWMTAAGAGAVVPGAAMCALPGGRIRRRGPREAMPVQVRGQSYTLCPAADGQQRNVISPASGNVGTLVYARPVQALNRGMIACLTRPARARLAGPVPPAGPHAARCLRIVAQAAAS